jgi:deazaflavin-dependent oxidoreductase (nitroreductase family)
MMSSPGYRPHVARAYARLYRPFRPGGRRRSRCDQMMARWWTHLDMAAYRHLGVSLGVKALGVNDVILLRTRGRRTGQVREVLVAYVELGGVPIVCGGNAGWDRPPGWFENLRDGGPVEIEYRDHHRTAVAPVILSGDAREQAFAVVYNAFPHVRLYLTRTSRPFPVVRLEPLEAQAAGGGATKRSAVVVHEGASPA